MKLIKNLTKAKEFEKYFKENIKYNIEVVGSPEGEIKDISLIENVDEVIPHLLDADIRKRIQIKEFRNKIKKYLGKEDIELSGDNDDCTYKTSRLSDALFWNAKFPNGDTAVFMTIANGVSVGSETNTFNFIKISDNEARKVYKFKTKQNELNVVAGKFYKITTAFQDKPHNIIYTPKTYNGGNYSLRTVNLKSIIGFKDITKNIDKSLLSTISSLVSTSNILELEKSYSEIKSLSLSEDGKQVEFVNENSSTGKIKTSKFLTDLGLSGSHFYEAMASFNHKIGEESDLYKSIEILPPSEIPLVYKNGSKAFESCMNKKRVEYFDLYKDNCKGIMVTKNSDGEVTSRALIWNMKKVGSKRTTTIVDRIYPPNNDVIIAYKQYAIKNGWATLVENGPSTNKIFLKGKELELTNFFIQLIKDEYRFYPYVDTFRIMDGLKLSTTVETRYTLQSTVGDRYTY